MWIFDLIFLVFFEFVVVGDGRRELVRLIFFSFFGWEYCYSFKSKWGMVLFF